MTDNAEKKDLVALIASPRSDEPTHCTAADYDRLYQESISDPDGFWSREAKRLDWQKMPTKISNASFDPVSIKWYEDGILNICHNAVDRHVAAGKGDVTALIFEPDDPRSPGRTISYAELQAEVIKMANCLKKLGVGKGDRVTVYMPMIARRQSGPAQDQCR
jgi:acetyl-CoA synthetase